MDGSTVQVSEKNELPMLGGLEQPSKEENVNRKTWKMVNSQTSVDLSKEQRQCRFIATGRSSYIKQPKVHANNSIGFGAKPNYINSVHDCQNFAF